MFSSLSKEFNTWLPISKKDTDVSLEVKEKTDDVTTESSTKEDNAEKNESEEKTSDVKSPTSPMQMVDMVTSWFGSKDISNKETLVESPNENNEKVTSPVANIGNLFYSAVNKAGQSVTEYGAKVTEVSAKVTEGAVTMGAKLKKTVEENSILGQFNKEQESFIREKNSTQSKAYAASLLPWAGHPNEDQLKAACLALSTDKNNFTRGPPPGVDFEFDYNTQFLAAMITLQHDKQLEKMRFELVPAQVPEAIFWRNYFYRVSLITQAHELSSLEAEHLSSQHQSASDSAATQDPSDQHDDSRSTSAQQRGVLKPSLNQQDFVSDTITSSNTDLDEIREEMKKLGLDTKTSNSNTTEDDWEKELDAEINEFEVVPQDGGAGSDAEIENALDTMDDTSSTKFHHIFGNG
uniref:Synapse-associated protein of 47 kDa n=1 Tax=Cacopsylla melanoneura TaxID=428564 RepID=A0A8D8TU08_9HEMI